MPPLEQVGRFTTAVLWARGSRDTSAGEMTRGTPVEIQITLSRNRRSVVDRDGNLKAIDASAVVDRIIEEGSLLYIGTLSQFLGTDSGDPELEQMQVEIMTDAKSINGRHTRYEAHLIYYRATPPIG